MQFHSSQYWLLEEHEQNAACIVCAVVTNCVCAIRYNVVCVEVHSEFSNVLLHKRESTSYVPQRTPWLPGTPRIKSFKVGELCMFYLKQRQARALKEIQE